MNLYRTGESGLVAVQSLDPAATDGLAAALLRGPGGELGGEDVMYVTTTVDDGGATALALDEDGNAVIVGAAGRTVDTAVVTRALQRASAVADSDYETLDADFEGEGSLREAHADYFEGDQLPREAFNDDQRVRLLGPTFDDDALRLATFLSDREVTVEPIRVEAFGDPESQSYLVQFESLDGANTAVEQASDTAQEMREDSDSQQQWIAGTNAAAATDVAVETGGDGGAQAEPAGAQRDGSIATPPEGAAGPGADAEPESTEEPESTTESAEETEDGDDDPEETLDIPVLLNAVAEGVGERLVGTFDQSAEELLSVERGSELLVRPDHPAYAGGVLRYRLRVDADGVVEFAVNIYGGSEAEKEQMRAVVRTNEEAIETELGYDVHDRYDGFSATREFGQYDQVAAAEIVDEFDRLVRFFHPRVMRA
ncbi:MAG: hypothetical protein ACOCQU_03030 [Halolamina sp.]